MPYWNRFDICEAYALLECDYNVGGWLRERPSNQRRMESCGVQLHRINFRSTRLDWDTLTENAKEIYLLAVLRLKLPLDEETHDLMIEILGADYWRAGTSPGIAPPSN
jgi:hypothetical protein